MQRQVLLLLAVLVLGTPLHTEVNHTLFQVITFYIVLTCLTCCLCCIVSFGEERSGILEKNTMRKQKQTPRQFSSRSCSESEEL